MKNTNNLSKEVQDGNAIAEKIHAAAATLTELIQAARQQKIVVHLDNASGYSASNGCRISAKITATISFDDGKTFFA